MKNGCAKFGIKRFRKLPAGIGHRFQMAQKGGDSEQRQLGLSVRKQPRPALTRKLSFAI